MKKRKKNVKMHSGEMLRYNLDPVTLDQLDEIGKLLRSNGINISQSVIVRRSIRDYLTSLKEVLIEGCLDLESILINRSRKGVL